MTFQINFLLKAYVEVADVMLTLIRLIMARARVEHLQFEYSQENNLLSINMQRVFILYLFNSLISFMVLIGFIDIWWF